MATAIQKYLSSDNKEFNSAAEADAHDAGLAHKGLIEAYIAAADVKVDGAQAGLLRKHLAGFIAFEAAYVPPVQVAEQPADAPAGEAVEG